ncbi:Uncharacterised protein [Algoriella xinjiangensis]|uniref:hypothetical protein n=1 Tax=Algoriella xinjiangensis TaxID=684065 RepID=UPI000F62D14F|nr:hypothetical protein [Algoriella xinjiangensis]VDH16847.1 Uncharacterised protein [Algoriella xinjiangensis]
MENTEYYEGLYNFLLNTPSGLKALHKDVVYLIKGNELILSHDGKERDVSKIIGISSSEDWLRLELEADDSLDPSTYIYIKKTNNFDELGKPIFEIEFYNSSADFVLFLINPEEK